MDFRPYADRYAEVLRGRSPLMRLIPGPYLRSRVEAVLKLFVLDNRKGRVTTDQVFGPLGEPGLYTSDIEPELVSDWRDS